MTFQVNQTIVFKDDYRPYWRAGDTGVVLQPGGKDHWMVVRHEKGNLCTVEDGRVVPTNPPLRYLLFKGESFYPKGDWDDFVASFDRLEDAVEAGEQSISGVDWYSVIDLKLGARVANRGGKYGVDY